MICNSCKGECPDIYDICIPCGRARIDESLSRICRKKIKLEYVK